MSSPVILSEFNSSGDILGYVTVELNKQRLTCKNLATNQIISTLYFDSGNDGFLLQVSVLKFFQYNGVEVCLVGLNNGELWLYSFNNNEIVEKLNTSSNFQINDVQITEFVNKTNYVYCSDLNNTLYQFDLNTFQLNWKLKLDEYLENVVKFHVMENNDKVLLCSHTISLMDLNTKTVDYTFPGHITQIQDIKTIKNSDYFITSAENDRFLNVYNYKDGSTKVVLNCSENIVKFSVSDSNAQFISCITESGELEAFFNPLNNNIDKNDNNVEGRNTKRKKRQQQLSKKSNLKLKFKQLSKNLSIINCQNISATNVLITWLENASIPFSQSLEINETVDYSSTNNTIEIPSKLNKQGSKHYQASDLSSNISYKEGNALVTSGDNFTNIENELSKVLNNIDEDELELSLQDQLQIHANKEAGKKNGVSNINSNKDDGTEHASGDIASSNGSNNNVTGVQKKKKKSKSTVIGTLTVILQQALKSNDHTLLDQVLGGTLDEKVIKLTIYRLSPQLSVILLERLAERIARNSKSFQSSSSSSSNSSSSSILEVWCKWCLIIHGAYLTSVPNLMNSLSTLHSTMKKRAGLLSKLSIIEERMCSVLQRNDLYRNDNLSMHSDNDEEEDGEDDLNDEAFEEDVEYVEELDDAGLLDDGEEDGSFSGSEDDYQESDSDGEYEEERGQFDIDKELVQEEAFSDVEM